jgi:hypothetical protein
VVISLALALVGDRVGEMALQYRHSSMCAGPCFPMVAMFWRRLVCPSTFGYVVKVIAQCRT